MNQEQSQIVRTGSVTALRRWMRRIAVALILVALTLLTSEALLRWIDPLGFWRYYNDLRAVRSNTWPHADRHFVAAPGRFELMGWSYRVDLPDYTRHTPSSKNEAGCTIVALGDSVTFGLGVDDGETWPNLLAEQTDCSVVNAGVPGYDLWTVYKTYTAFPEADKYVYLLIENDAAHDTERLADVPPSVSAVKAYLYLLEIGAHHAHPATVPDDFWAVYDALASDPRVIICGFRDGGLAEQVAASGREITLLEPYTSRISWADAHPDSTGQTQIVAGIMRAISRNQG